MPNEYCDFDEAKALRNLQGYIFMSYKQIFPGINDKDQLRIINEPRSDEKAQNAKGKENSKQMVIIPKNGQVHLPLNTSSAESKETDNSINNYYEDPMLLRTKPDYGKKSSFDKQGQNVTDMNFTKNIKNFTKDGYKNKTINPYNDVSGHQAWQMGLRKKKGESAITLVATNKSKTPLKGGNRNTGNNTNNNDNNTSRTPIRTRITHQQTKNAMNGKTNSGYQSITQRQDTQRNNLTQTHLRDRHYNNNKSNQEPNDFNNQQSCKSHKNTQHTKSHQLASGSNMINQRKDNTNQNDTDNQNSQPQSNNKLFEINFLEGQKLSILSDKELSNQLYFGSSQKKDPNQQYCNSDKNILVNNFQNLLSANGNCQTPNTIHAIDEKLEQQTSSEEITSPVSINIASNNYEHFVLNRAGQKLDLPELDAISDSQICSILQSNINTNVNNKLDEESNTNLVISTNQNSLPKLGLAISEFDDISDSQICSVVNSNINANFFQSNMFNKNLVDENKTFYNSIKQLDEQQENIPDSQKNNFKNFKPKQNDGTDFPIHDKNQQNTLKCSASLKNFAFNSLISDNNKNSSQNLPQQNLFNSSYSETNLKSDFKSPLNDPIQKSNSEINSETYTNLTNDMTMTFNATITQTGDKQFTQTGDKQLTQTANNQFKHQLKKQFMRDIKKMENINIRRQKNKTLDDIGQQTGNSHSDNNMETDEIFINNPVQRMKTTPSYLIQNPFTNQENSQNYNHQQNYESQQRFSETNNESLHQVNNNSSIGVMPSKHNFRDAIPSKNDKWYSRKLQNKSVNDNLIAQIQDEEGNSLDTGEFINNTDGNPKLNQYASVERNCIENSANNISSRIETSFTKILNAQKPIQSYKNNSQISQQPNYDHSPDNVRIANNGTKNNINGYLSSNLVSGSKISIGGSGLNTSGNTHALLSKSTKFKKNFSIYTMGGINEQNSMIVEKFDSRSSNWTVVETRSIGRNKFGCIMMPSKKILVFGGKTYKNDRLKTSEEFDLKTLTWKQGKIELYEPKSGFGYILQNKKVYVAGGNNGQIALNTFEEYDVFTNERHRLQNMIIPRDELSLVACNGGIFAIGGGSYNGAVLKSVERYDFNNGIWEKIPDMIIPRRAHSLCCVNNKIYAFGGFDGEKYLSSVETYDEKASRWVQIKFMSSSRCTHVSVKSPDNNSIIIIGGYNGKSLNIVERYDIEDNEWSSMNYMNYSRSMHSALICAD